MEDTEPHFSDDELRGIKVPTWIVDGDRDEEDPEQFNEALLHFLSRH
jgi:hypothetical protein